VHALLSANPESPRVPDKLLRLPLHWACDSASANAHVVAALIKAYPDALDDEDSVRVQCRCTRSLAHFFVFWLRPSPCVLMFLAMQRCAMPLHLACSHSNIDPAIVKLLLQECPSAASFAGEVSGCVRLCLPFCLCRRLWPTSACLTSTTHVAVHLRPASQEGNGWLPLHYALSCKYPQVEVFNELVAANPDGLFEVDAVRDTLGIVACLCCHALNQRVTLCCCPALA